MRRTRLGCEHAAPPVLVPSDRIAMGVTAGGPLGLDLGRPAAEGRLAFPPLRAARARTSSASESLWRHLQLTPNGHSPPLRMFVHMATLLTGDPAGESTADLELPVELLLRVPCCCDCCCGLG